MIFRATRRLTGVILLRHVDDSHAPFTDLLQELVGTDHGANGATSRASAHRPLDRPKNSPWFGVRVDHRFDVGPQRWISLRHTRSEIRLPLGALKLSSCLEYDRRVLADFFGSVICVTLIQLFE